jgi:hypothetical protein
MLWERGVDWLNKLKIGRHSHHIQEPRFSICSDAAFGLSPKMSVKGNETRFKLLIKTILLMRQYHKKMIKNAFKKEDIIA